MQNGENVQVLYKNLEMVRFVSVFVLLLHFYCCCLPAFTDWGLAPYAVTKIIYSFTRGLSWLTGVTPPKIVALLLLMVSLFGTKGKKDEKLEIKPIFYYLAIGLVFYFFSNCLLNLSISESAEAVIYMTVTAAGYLMILAGGARLSRLLRTNFGKDPFNALQETFPQEERKLENEYSINLPAQYNLKGKIRKSWINIINPFRACSVLGTPGS